MKPWEFVVEKPSDLPVLADLLAEWGHPGEEAVRWLAAGGKWPTKTPSRKMPRCLWLCLPAGQVDDRPHIISGVFAVQGKVCFYHHTLTEAVWAVVNAWLGRAAGDAGEGACPWTSSTG
jgi:hypothetical protein